MKTYKELMAEQEQIDERVIRTGTVAALAAKSAAAGKKADKAYRKGLSLLGDSTQHDDLFARLDRIDAALKAILEAQLHQSHQISDHVGLDTIGHLARKKTRR